MMTQRKGKAGQAAPLLSRGEPGPFTRVNARHGAKSRIIILCDHASNRIPRALKGLGLSPADRRRHIAWDPGTEDIGRYLSRKLKAPLLLANYSRLVVDLNRGEGVDSFMPAVSGGVRIPGNRRLSAAARQARIDALFTPYHEEISRMIARVEKRGEVPFLLLVHSFTPVFDGVHRPWHIGIMWNAQEKLSMQLVRRLRRDNPAVVIGQNQPYDMKKDAWGKHTLQRHGDGRGLPSIVVEFRQDLVGRNRDEAEGWAELFLRSLAPVLESPFAARRRRRR